MKIASVAEVKSQLSAFLKASEGGPVVVTRNGRPVAVIVGVQDEDEIERLLMAYSPHLRAIDAKYHALIQEKIGEQLRFEPATETTNRKPLRPPALLGATWEVRFGSDNRFRVLYDIDHEARVVQIMAIGEKRRERLFIGGEEVQL